MIASVDLLFAASKTSPLYLACLGTTLEIIMDFILAGIAAASLLIYLIYAMFNPKRF